jgi:hypothetical protein
MSICGRAGVCCQRITRGEREGERGASDGERVSLIVTKPLSDHLIIMPQFHCLLVVVVHISFSPIFILILFCSCCCNFF